MLKKELKCKSDGTINWFKSRCLCLHKEELDEGGEEDPHNNNNQQLQEGTELKKEPINEKRDRAIVQKLLPSYKFDNSYSIGESDSHACLVHDGIVYFWGGRNETEGKIHRLDMKSYCWLSPLPNNLPKKESRYYHSFIKQGNEPIFWMFGGLDNVESIYFNDLISVNVSSSSRNSTSSAIKWEHFEEPTSTSTHGNDEWPAKRRGHVFVYRESNHSLLMYGGCGDEVYSDLWEFNISKKKWKLLHTRNEIQPRGYSSGIIMKKKQVSGGGGDSNTSLETEFLVVYGGDIGVSNQTLTNELCLLNLNTMEWSTLNNSITPPLFGHACTTCKVSNDEMLIYGGCNDDYIPYSDLYIYNLKFNAWSKVSVENILPLNCSSVFVDEERGFINFYGGYDHERRTNTHILIQVNPFYDCIIARNFPKLFGCLAFTDAQIKFNN